MMDWVNDTCAIACWNCEGHEIHEHIKGNEWRCTNCGHVKQIADIQTGGDEK